MHVSTKPHSALHFVSDFNIYYRTYYLVDIFYANFASEPQQKSCDNRNAGPRERLRMSLFNKKRSVRALDQDSLDAIKRELDSTLNIAANFDKLMAKTGKLAISLEGRVRGDLLAFVLYLDGVGRGGPTDPNEIRVVNKIFDIDLSHVDFELFRNDVGDTHFEHAVPASVLIFNEMGKSVQRAQFTKSDGTVSAEGQTNDLSDLFVCGLINLYALIGSAFISADSVIHESESADLIRYVSMINSAVFGKGAPLPEGAASNALAAHVRLFGKKPKGL